MSIDQANPGSGKPLERLGLRGIDRVLNDTGDHHSTVEYDSIGISSLPRCCPFVEAPLGALCRNH
jgi:hypothetical protein